jgi:RHS repeat-associated protein
LHDPSAPDSGSGSSVWVEKPEFALPVPIRAGTRFADLDGNGAVDIIHGRTIIMDATTGNRWDESEGYLAPDTHSDLLASVDNGRGGITDFTYVSAVVQQDDAMEADAEAHAATIGDTDGNSEVVTRFIQKPVISEQTVSGVGIAANVTTHYRYARPRYDPVEHSGLGFGLVETTNPDNSRVDAYRYQREGLVGRRSVRKAFDEGGNQIHHSAQTWVLASNPGNIPGAMAGVDVARLDAQESYNVYGQGDGPLKEDVYSYDDSYGYNFVSQVISTRATSALTTTLTPDVEAFDETKWLVGLVGEKKQLDAGITYSREVYDYTTNGKLASRSRDIGLRDGIAASDIATTSWAYDSWGNATSLTDTRGGGESNRVVEFCYDGDGGGNSWCPSLPGGTPTTHSLRVGLKDAIGGATELEYDWVTGAVLHVERINESGDFRDSMTVVRDAFGRSQEQWFRGASFGGGDPDVLLASTIYHDTPIVTTPAYVERFQYAEEGAGTPIRTARYLDGFGNTLREVSETPSGYRGIGVFRDPATRIVRSVGPIDCNLAAACVGNITETTEPATEREVDAAGRVIRITSPDGEVTQDYSRMPRVQPAGSGTGDVFDTVEITDSNSHTTRRLMEGNRVVWVDECLDASCAAFDSTFYTYEPTGAISTIYDALANSVADYASPARYLRYHYDTLGRAIQVDEPNTGSSSAEYDHQGNVTSTTNVRGATTFTNYDALGRLLSIDRPVGVGEWDLDFAYDPISRKRKRVTTIDSPYSDTWEYDDFGRVKRQVRTYYDTLAMDFEYDLLGRPTKIYYPGDNSSASYVYLGAYLDQVCRGDDFCVSAPENLLISNVQYDGLGRRIDTVTSAGTVHREYFGMSDPLAGRSVKGLKRLAITAGTADGALDFNYQYDPMGNITGIDDRSTSYDASAMYTYDERNRLESWTDADDNTQWYTYDSLGNLEGHGVVSAGGTNQVFDPTVKPHQTALNRSGEDYAYDADGNVIKRGTTHFVYDSANRLVCTGTALGSCDGPGYRYDADGQLLWDGAVGQQLMGEFFRWQSSSETAYSNITAFGEVIAEVRQASAQLYDPFASAPIAWPLPSPKGPLLWMLTGAGVLSLIALLASLGAGPAFIAAPATATLALVLTTLLVVPPPAWGGPKRGGGGRGDRGVGGGRRTVTTVRAFFRDHLGSAAYVTGPNKRQAYEPFGKEILTGTAAADEFTGKEYHGATDMYYFGARWYDAEAGRFAGADPLVARPTNPQELNAYSYTLNEPVNYIDPTGKFTMCTPFATVCFGDGGRSYHSNAPGGFQPFAPNWISPSSGQGPTSGSPIAMASYLESQGFDATAFGGAPASNSEVPFPTGSTFFQTGDSDGILEFTLTQFSSGLQQGDEFDGVSFAASGTFGSTIGSIWLVPVGVFGAVGVNADGSIGTEGGAGVAAGAFAGAGFSGGVNVHAGQPPDAELAFVFAVVIPGTGVGPIFDARVSLDTVGARAQIGLARGAGALGFIGVVFKGPNATFSEFFRAAENAATK